MSSGTETDRSTFLLAFYSNQGPISYRFRDKWRFQLKIAKFSHPRVFCAPAEGVPIGIGYRRWGTKKSIMMGLPDRERSLMYDIFFSRVDTIHQRDRRTNTGQQQRPRLCPVSTASRGKTALVQIGSLYFNIIRIRTAIEGNGGVSYNRREDIGYEDMSTEANKRHQQFITEYNNTRS